MQQKLEKQVTLINSLHIHSVVVFVVCSFGVVSWKTSSSCIDDAFSLKAWPLLHLHKTSRWKGSDGLLFCCFHCGVPAFGRERLRHHVCNSAINAAGWENLLFFTCPVTWNLNASSLAKAELFPLVADYLTQPFLCSTFVLFSSLPSRVGGGGAQWDGALSPTSLSSRGVGALI